jgi:heme-degrading monooxygenase HmoA
MIARLWHGVTSPENANEYEDLLRREILPGIHRVEGYRGAYLLRREVPEGAEFVTLTLFDSMEAVRRFAGDDVERAVVPQEARKFLARFDQRSAHYTILVEPPSE